MFSRILIANRGEVALRIIRACKELGIESVAIYSQADSNASYLHLADERVCIGKAPSADSYLNIPRIIAAAEIADVEAIHPGYGFLAENAHFLEVCQDCKIEFIGPSHESMTLLGDKIRAKALAREVNVPMAPDSEGAVESVEDALDIAERIGYPVAIKAAAGGGGRGIRFAHNAASLKSMYQQAKAEAEIAFNDGTLFMEKCIENFRHIEVQLLGDKHGNVVHLYERDCSVQRRQQKVVEETPAPGLDPGLRKQMCEAAVRLAKACDYYNAGTVEFMLDENNNFYFLEVNTRIQVEHPITEMVTGVDLVKWQLRIAAGEKLTFTQDDIKPSGVAIECRINAEDPANNFRPSPGEVKAFVAPGGFGVRWDSHVYQGYNIPPTYDSLVGKLIVHQPTRSEAIATTKRALDEFVIEPTKTTVPLCRRVMSEQKFVDAQWDTKYIEREMLED
ncbi:MAG: acetyl-CoA carboxylase biotin carboxylase subunit [Phycisphaerae bacterium]|jgi:acetyl-CoA carboxylase biotin carboxylase subunit|nr:acetyl-CoA carboxylase biotin carboxylase subunit [Phycisphaerae bacterium]MDP7287549.1 acetyl-CoA carboxylase biotin carboxylase subunit [Phycisphaerae bacterium]